MAVSRIRTTGPLDRANRRLNSEGDIDLDRRRLSLRIIQARRGCAMGAILGFAFLVSDALGPWGHSDIAGLIFAFMSLAGSLVCFFSLRNYAWQKALTRPLAGTMAVLEAYELANHHLRAAIIRDEASVRHRQLYYLDLERMRFVARHNYADIRTSRRINEAADMLPLLGDEPTSFWVH